MMMMIEAANAQYMYTQKIGFVTIRDELNQIIP